MRNKITITGDIGSGKSTVCNILKDRLNYDLITGGSVFRKIADEEGISVLDVNKKAENNTKIDDKVDCYLKTLNERDFIIVDSRLAWFFIKDSLKIYLYVTKEEATKRIAKSNRTTEGDILNHSVLYKNISKRQDAETERFKRLYGLDIRDLSNYDLVIDTTKITPYDVVNIIMEYKGGYDVYLNIDNLVPTQRVRELSDNRINYYKDKIEQGLKIELIDVVYKDGIYYLIDGHHRLVAYNDLGITHLECNLVEGNVDILDISSLYDWEDLMGIKYTY